MTSLKAAVEADNLDEVFKLLSEIKGKEEEENALHEAILTAIATNNDLIFSVLLGAAASQGQDADRYMKAYLHADRPIDFTAAVVELLINAGYNPFHEAVVAEVLIKHGADVDAVDIQGHTPLMLLAGSPFYTGSAECDESSRATAKVLIEAGADIELFMESICLGCMLTPLMEASVAGNIGAVQALIEAGADLEVKDPENGATALNLSICQ